MRILLGKTKGVFVIDEGRVQGPFCDGWPINHVAADPKSGRIYAAGGGVSTIRPPTASTKTLLHMARRAWMRPSETPCMGNERD